VENHLSNGRREPDRAGNCGHTAIHSRRGKRQIYGTERHMRSAWVQQLFGEGGTPPLAIVVAHPDDEAIGAGAQLRRWPHAQVIHTTDGAPRHSAAAWQSGYLTAEEYASARERESITALTQAGIGLRQLHHLGFTDQETALNLVSLTEALADKFLELQPKFVITHPYEGGHPDHDSTTFALHAACDILLHEQGFAPAIVEMTSYFNRAGIMATSEFLPRARSVIETRVLTEEEKEFKQRLFACFKTQQHALQYFPISIERFRLAPHYDFTKPPHEGRLYYELFKRGTTGERWRKLAQAALKRLNGTDRVNARAEVFFPA
jgi:LmbE family N-acetylglucosaminyl deacetylase